MSTKNGVNQRTGCVVVVWVFLIALGIFLALFLYRVWFFYGQIKKEGIGSLSQFTGRLTTINGAQALKDSPLVSREILEDETDKALLGNKDASLTIVLFADFECPFSKEVSTTVRAMSAKYNDRVRILFRHFPIDGIHVNARNAALAAECAHEQQKFWAYHDRLFFQSSGLSFGELVESARSVGMNISQFEQCLSSERYANRVSKDLALAEKLQLRGTPTFFFNGNRVEGAIPSQMFEQIINHFIQR